MLPSWLDLSSLKLSMWVLIVIGVFLALLVVKHMEQAMLRVFVASFIIVFCLVCYFYQKGLTECKTQDKNCSFFGYEIPKSGGILAD
jgi:uncharacterized protein YqhQ